MDSLQREAMEISVNIYGDKPQAIISHKGKRVEFRVSFFNRETFSPEQPDKFLQLNSYWRSLPEHIQDTIFQIYFDIHDSFSTFMNTYEMEEFIKDKIAHLLSYHSLESIKNWMGFGENTNIVIPSDMKVEYVHDIDKNTSREKTYLRSDYIDLVAFALAIRPVAPIWGHFISMSRARIGNNFKERYAFRLLDKTQIIHTEPVWKLKEYIKSNIGDEEHKADDVLLFISSEEYPYFLFCNVCVKKICIVDISGKSDLSLIQHLYKFLMQRINEAGGDGTGGVREKNFDESGATDDAKVSSLERYRIKTNIPPADIEALEYSISNVFNYAGKLSSLMSMEAVTASLNTSSVLNNHRISTAQMILLRWIMAPVIPPKGLLYLSKPNIVKALGVAEAVLWARGHKYLALVAGLYPIESESTFHITSVGAKEQTPKDLKDRIEEIFKFSQVPSNRRNGPSTKNLVFESIESVIESLSAGAYRMSSADWMIEEVFGAKIKKFQIKPDIRTDLAKLVIEIGENSWI
jgi:hypothetical protein